MFFIALIVVGCNENEEIGITPESLEEEFGIERVSSIPDGVEPLRFNSEEELYDFLSQRRKIKLQDKGEVLEFPLGEHNTSVKSGQNFNFTVYLNPDYYWFSDLLVCFEGIGDSIVIRTEMVGVTIGVNFKVVSYEAHYLTSNTFEFNIIGVEYYHVPSLADLFSSSITIHGKGFIQSKSVQCTIN